MEDFKVENVSATNYLYFAKKDLVFVDCPSDTLAANVDGVCLGFLFIIRLAELSITQLNIASCLLPSLPPNSTVKQENINWFMQSPTRLQDFLVTYFSQWWKFYNLYITSDDFSLSVLSSWGSCFWLWPVTVCLSRGWTLAQMIRRLDNKAWSQLVSYRPHTLPTSRVITDRLQPASSSYNQLARRITRPQRSI